MCLSRPLETDFRDRALGPDPVAWSGSGTHFHAGSPPADPSELKRRPIPDCLCTCTQEYDEAYQRWLDLVAPDRREVELE